MPSGVPTGVPTSIAGDDAFAFGGSAAPAPAFARPETPTPSASPSKSGTTRDRVDASSLAASARSSPSRLARSSPSRGAAFGPPSPVEVALRWHEREHARLSAGEAEREGVGDEVDGARENAARQGSPRARMQLRWNQAPVYEASPSPSPARRERPDALEASPEASSSDPGSEEDDAEWDAPPGREADAQEGAQRVPTLRARFACRPTARFGPAPATRRTRRRRRRRRCER